MSYDSKIINLNKVTDAQVLDKEDSLLQCEAYEKLLERIDEVLKKRDEFKMLGDPQSSFIKTRTHNTTAVFGERGIGKTTFLLNSLHRISTESKYANDILNLGLIDPTLLDNKANIIYIVISRIQELIYKRYDSGVLDKDITRWENATSKLARGLLFSNDSTPSFEADFLEDPRFIHKMTLEYCRGSLNLEDDYHDFISESLKILDRKILVLAFDDVDTNFKKGWPVLEFMRKYQTSPETFTLLSGDLKLFNILISKNVIENFGDSFLKQNDDFSQLNLKEMETHIRNQYLQKILKVQNSIKLIHLYDRKDDYFLKIDESGNTIGIDILTKLIIENFFGVQKKEYRDEVEFLLLNQSTREVLQLFRYFSKKINLNEYLNEGIKPKYSTKNEMLKFMYLHYFNDFNKVGLTEEVYKLMNPVQFCHALLITREKKGIEDYYFSSFNFDTEREKIVNVILPEFIENKMQGDYSFVFRYVLLFAYGFFENEHMTKTGRTLERLKVEPDILMSDIWLANYLGNTIFNHRLESGVVRVFLKDSNVLGPTNYKRYVRRFLEDEGGDHYKQYEMDSIFIQMFGCFNNHIRYIKNKTNVTKELSPSSFRRCFLEDDVPSPFLINTPASLADRVVGKEDKFLIRQVFSKVKGDGGEIRGVSSFLPLIASGVKLFGKGDLIDFFINDFEKVIDINQKEEMKNFRHASRRRNNDYLENSYEEEFEPIYYESEKITKSIARANKLFRQRSFFKKASIRTDDYDPFDLKSIILVKALVRTLEDCRKRVSRQTLVGTLISRQISIFLNNVVLEWFEYFLSKEELLRNVVLESKTPNRDNRLIMNNFNKIEEALKTRNLDKKKKFIYKSFRSLKAFIHMSIWGVYLDPNSSYYRAAFKNYREELGLEPISFLVYDEEITLIDENLYYLLNSVARTLK